jgi:8-oxo-dGTP pyrophosphatase MutT (NUDIX family)
MGEVSPEVKNKLEGLSKDKVALLKDLETLSRNANALVGGLFESRSGTLKQRWARDPVTQEYMRLVAGCVPILKDSRILLIRSSGGNGWLIPKGGWEDDENLEECAIRESYEESGVLGVLGLKLGTYKVETRKARAVRLEGDKDATCSAAWIVEPCNLASLLPTTHLVMPDEHVSGKLPHSHVCMSFFPLYVHTVKSAWPESHRRRRAFTIDGK